MPFARTTPCSIRSELLKPGANPADQESMLKMLTGLTLWLLLFALYPLSTRAQVHGSGGGPGGHDHQMAICTEMRDRSRELEKEYMESRKLTYENDDSFFDEVQRLTAKTLYKTVKKTNLTTASCGEFQLPPHTREQIELLQQIERLWQKGDDSRKNCLDLFKTRSWRHEPLKCVIRSLSHESK
jgi:hypothetical protein